MVDLNAETVNSVIARCWGKVRTQVEDHGHPLSSEKTLCFLMAMAIRDKCGSHITFDFENQCYKGLPGESKYLDLLISTDKDFKIAIELKLPRKSKSGSSDQKGTREAVYRDLARLSYLRHRSQVTAAFFLMAVNEDAYLNNINVKKNAEYITRQGHVIHLGNNLKASNLSLGKVECTFEWLGVQMGSRKWCRTGRFAWLKPIGV